MITTHDDISRYIKRHNQSKQGKGKGRDFSLSVIKNTEAWNLQRANKSRLFCSLKYRLAKKYILLFFYAPRVSLNFFYIQLHKLHKPLERTGIKH